GPVLVDGDRPAVVDGVPAACCDPAPVQGRGVPRKHHRSAPDDARSARRYCPDDSIVAGMGRSQHPLAHQSSDRALADFHRPTNYFARAPSPSGRKVKISLRLIPPLMRAASLLPGPCLVARTTSSVFTSWGHGAARCTM